MAEAHGGRYPVRGARSEALEGDWSPERLVILEFPSFERAQEWWACEEYREPKAMRQRAGKPRMVVVEGA